MTVQTSTNVASFNGDGANKVFPIGYKFNSAADLVVTLIDDEAKTTQILTLNSDFTVTGAGDEEGGAVTLIVAPTAVQRLKATRVVDILQLTDLRNQGKFYAEIHEDVFDLLIMIDQQQQTEIDDSNAKSDEAVATANEANAKSDQAVAKADQNLVDMQAQYDAFEQGASLVVIGDYAAGLVVDSYNKVFRKDGELYRASASLDLPYTLTGNWATESANFVSVGDNVLRQELASSAGAELVGLKGTSTVADLARSDDPSMGAALIGYSGRSQADRNNDHRSIMDFPGTATERFQAAFDLGGGFLVPAGAYEISGSVSGTADVSLFFAGPVTVLCTAETVVPAVFKTSGLLSIEGGAVTIDCNGKAYLGFHCPIRLPTCSNITVKNSLSLAWCCGAEFDGTAANSYSGATGVGEGYLDHCFALNCGSLGIFRGSGKTSATSFQLRECGTDDQTGFVTNIFNIGEMRRGSVIGGNFRGIPTQAPNMTRTAECEYIGGLYEGLTRGPTVGEGVESVTMVGGVSKNIASYGISCDARITSDNTVPEITGTVDWTCIDCERDAFVQAGGVFLKSINGRNPKQNSNASVRLTDAKNVKIGTLISTGAGAKPLLELGAGGDPVPGSSAILLGGLYTDSTNAVPFRLTSPSSSMQIGRQRVVSANYRATWQDETIIADATAGSFTIYFPEVSVSENLIGKKWTVKVRSTVNSISLSRQGGGATAINGASSYSIGASGAPRSVEVEALGNGNYLVSVSV